MNELIQDIETYLDITQSDDWYIRRKLNQIKGKLDNYEQRTND